MSGIPVIALTPGEPAGVGPDLAVVLAQSPPRSAALVLLADPAVLSARARSLGLPPFAPPEWNGARVPGVYIEPHRVARPVTPGRPDPGNARYVLETLAAAADGCLAGRFDALVTGPVHKGLINDAGIPFTGHTEFLAERAGGADVVMMLACEGLRVALATTHLPLSEVPRALTRERLTRVLRVLDRELRAKFGIAAPRIRVLGLNPHAGESGHLGREEIEIIAPVIERLGREEGLRLEGPVPADTAFVPASLNGVDAVLAMYHDQGLPVVKHHDFAHTVNVTLGLPFVRTSVDHGTAFELAGTGRAMVSSLEAALAAAIELAGKARAR
jgi:4-hydroxythreonine-4-phosphate dehydrogenase